MSVRADMSQDREQNSDLVSCHRFNSHDAIVAQGMISPFACVMGLGGCLPTRVERVRFANSVTCGIMDMHIRNANATNGSSIAFPMSVESIR